MKIPRYIILFLSLLLIFHASQAQDEKRANVWYFGYNAGIDFNSGTPRSLTDSKMSQWEGSASICDINGKLLLYTNGIQIWNNKHHVIPGAIDLGGNDTSTESAIIIPKPGNPNIYYVFTTFKELTCVIVDITLNKGEGGIISKNILMNNSTEKLTGVQHCNKKDFWIVAHEAGNNVFRIYLLSDKGLETSSVKSKIGKNNFSPLGHLRFSPTGSKIAAAICGQSTFELYDFDTSSGKISNLVSLVHPDFKRAYGIEFSPDESYIYVTETLNTANRIFQLEIGSKKAADILKSKMIIGKTTESYFGALKLGPDNKIYVARNQMEYLGVINEPNRKGLNSSYVNNGLKLSAGVSSIGLPNLITSFNQEKPLVHIEEEKDCSIHKLSARLSSYLPGLLYQWYNGNTLIAQANKITYNPTRSGIYSVMVTNDCSQERLYSDTVKINIFNAEPTSIKVECGLYKLVSNTKGKFQWAGENITETQESLDSITVSGSGAKSFTLRVFDEDDPTCFIEKTVNIDFGICDANVFAPNIFTPNRDGINDTFKIEIVGGRTSRLDIYDRWGTLIFSSTNAEADWNGKINAVDCSVGNYVYVLKYKTERGEEYERKGSVMLQR